MSPLSVSMRGLCVWLGAVAASNTLGAAAAAAAAATAAAAAAAAAASARRWEAHRREPCVHRNTARRQCARRIGEDSSEQRWLTNSALAAVVRHCQWHGRRVWLSRDAEVYARIAMDRVPLCFDHPALRVVVRSDGDEAIGRELRALLVAIVHVR